MVRMETIVLFGAAALAGAGGSEDGRSQIDGYLWPSPREVEAAARGAAAGFGGAVALVGDVALVGVPRGIVRGEQRGLVRVAARTPGGGEWLAAPVETWAAPSLAPGARFGAAIVAAPGLAAVGAPRADGPGGSMSGVVQLYALDEGSGRSAPLERLAPPAGSDGAGFGSSLAIDPGGSDAARVAVGAPFARNGATGAAFAGAVFVYERVGDRWSLEATLRSPAPTVAAMFGTTLAWVDGTLVVGAPGDGRAAPGAGRVFGFDGDGALAWEAPPPGTRGAAGAHGAAGARYGSALWGLDATTVAIGVGGRGAVEVIDLGAGAPRFQALLRGDPLVGFGLAITGVGDDLIVGVPRGGSAIGAGVRGGAVRRYRRRGAVWSHAETIRPRPATEDGEFGVALAAARGGDGVARLLVGEPTSDHACAGVAPRCRAGRAVVLSLP